MNEFGFYRKPVMNKQKYRVIDLERVALYVRGDYAREQTEALRAMIASGADGDTTRKYKSFKFDYVTFSGVFRDGDRSAGGLESHSGLICLDFDHVEDVEGAFRKITEDEEIGARFVFRSPSGDGVKVVVDVDLAQGTHLEWFEAWSALFEERFGLKGDRNVKDVCRPCYLCHDPKAFLR